jgi:hypothetical protein
MTKYEAAMHYVKTMCEIANEIEKAIDERDDKHIIAMIENQQYGAERALAIIKGERSDEDASAWGDESWMYDILARATKSEVMQ